MKNISSNNLSQTKRAIFNILKVQVITYFLTIILLILLAFIMFKVDLADKDINLGIIIIMIVSTFIGGLMAGKVFKTKKWMYGLIIGVTYFATLLIISSIISAEGAITNDVLSMFIMCVGGGTLGGMIS
jgi:putative membrane protein (TIGR04086 family)